MDLRKLDRMLEQGRRILVRYEYPGTVRTAPSDSIYKTRIDRLLDVATDRNRLFVEFNGRVPIWIEKYEAIDAWAEDEMPTDVAA